MVSPAEFLGLIVAITFIAAVINLLLRRARRCQFAALAARWGMNYTPRDQFRLTPRAAQKFPVPGAANLHIIDLIYGMQGEHYRYVFTVQYTIGVVGGKRRVSRAACLTDPREKGADRTNLPVTLAPGHLRLLEQYERLAPTNDSNAGNV